QEVDDGRDDEEVQRGVHEVPVQEPAAMDGKGEVGEIRLRAQGGDERGDEVLDQGMDHVPEGHADDDPHRQVDDVPAQHKGLEIVEKPQHNPEYDSSAI